MENTQSTNNQSKRLNNNALPPPIAFSAGGLFSRISHFFSKLFIRRGKNFSLDRRAMRVADRYGLRKEYKAARRFGLSSVRVDLKSSRSECEHL